MSFARKVFVIMVLVVAVTSGSASAGLHFVGSGSVGSGSLVVHAEVAGYGNASTTGTVTVSLNVSGTDLDALCQNKGGKFAPGQNPVDINVQASQTVEVLDNGKTPVDFHVELLPGTKDAGCPSGKWTVVDLLGYIRVELTAVATTVNKQGVEVTDTARLAFDCYIEEANQLVSCTQDNSVS